MREATSIAAEALLKARKTGETIAALPTGSEPQTIRDAYAIQDEVSKVMSPIMGWKVGPSRSGPDIFTAPLFRDTIVTGSSLSIAGLKQPLLESELAFRLRAPLTASTPTDQILDTLQFVPLFEILGSRFSDIFKTPPMSLVADNNASGFIKIGPIVEHWRDIPDAQKQFRIEAGGKVLDSFNYTEKLKEAIELTLAVIRSQDGRKRDLPAGLVITNGSIIKPATVAGDIVADYGPLGTNRLTIHI